MFDVARESLTDDALPDVAQCAKRSDWHCPTIHSMLRRLNGWDYRQRAIYQITVTTVDRAQSAFGHIEVRRRGAGDWLPLALARGRGWRPDDIEARFVANAFGEATDEALGEMSRQWPDVEVLARQIMPDHIHAIIFVKAPISKPLGSLIRGFKAGAAKRWREILANRPENGPAQDGESPAITSQGGDGAAAGAVPARSRAGFPQWSAGYQDTILFHDGQLANMRHYLADNARRRAIKYLFPGLFRVVDALSVDLPFGTCHFSALGNRFLLDRPLAQVQVSRRDFGYEREPKPGGGSKIVRDGEEPRVAFSSSTYRQKHDMLLEAARHGTVLISPCVSDGERQIAREALAAGCSLIVLQNKGFSPLQKPSGRHFTACSNGQLLMLAPMAWPYQPNEKPMTRSDATALNRLTQWLVGDNAAKINYHGMTPANVDALAALAVGCRAPSERK